MGWLDPQWFTPEALVAEWRRKDIPKMVIAAVTFTVVLALFCQPETASLAVYIDSVGIDVFLALLEMQLIVILLLYRDQLLAWLRKAYVADHAAGAALRKLLAFGRHLREALRGSFRE